MIWAALAALAAGGVYLMSKTSTAAPGTDAAMIKAKAMIIKWEGFKDRVYLDTAGKKTIGYGHLLTAGETFPAGVTRQQAEAMLERDMRAAVRAVDASVKTALTVNQRAALISFTYNVGAGALQKSTMRALINKGDMAGASRQFDLWVMSGGKRTPGLVNRRADEKNLFLA